MTTPEQIQANRQNALCSTGPRTAEGKTTSSVNAVKHGILSAQAVVPGEVLEEYSSFAAALWLDLAPVGAVEGLLADQVVASAWRLRRVHRLDARMFHAAALGDFHGELLVPIGELAPKLARYQAAIERSLYRALHELQRLQTVRLGPSVAPSLSVGLSVQVESRP